MQRRGKILLDSFPAKNRTFRAKFGFEREKEVVELGPYKRHELSPGAYCLYVPNFYSDETEHSIFKKLMERLPFKQQENIFAGKVSLEPRLSCWYGNRIRHHQINIVHAS